MTCCDNCCYPVGHPEWSNKIKNLIKLDELKDTSSNLLYPESNFAYCLNCWENKKNEFKCEKCNKDIIGYHCEKGMPLLKKSRIGQVDERDYKRVCYNCKCDGTDCDYC